MMNSQEKPQTLESPKPEESAPAELLQPAEEDLRFKENFERKSEAQGKCRELCEEIKKVGDELYARLDHTP